ncbi:uncharacterized protein BX664DRAFT_358556 [Halteromyces radiatus]|uniref:uncharacterized protein n=1 Tax=Halteromyces radiatus TaxID=101107 RepID=UPI002220F80E|nr:uncharacterized protein BX664DRAFT_358556 [Halteromyces radiatus]KAI8088941.1 hypothetical protein BX664DRAFT_358556 [Halteromyces radiatus]
MSNNKETNQNANKDLSCLRCRKKKAKCSKTRPTCARCERSNQPCEYPDAPPNLTDLSKKVLDLYDSLRDLEGEFLFKYMQQSGEQENDIGDSHTDNINDNSSSLSNPQRLSPPSSPAEQPVTNEAVSTSVTSWQQQLEEESVKEQTQVSWSMSYLSEGISIQATTHTINEFIVFIDNLTRQLFRDFGTDSTLSTYWELDSVDHGDLNDDYYLDNNKNGYDDDDELDEDAYLVTVPIFTTSYFLLNQQQQQHKKSSTCAPDTPIVVSLLPSMLHYVHIKLQSLDTNSPATISHHITLLLDHLVSFLPAQVDHSEHGLLTDPLTIVYILTSYLTCKVFLQDSDDKDNTDKPTDPLIGKALTLLDCYNYTKTTIIDIVLQVTPTYAACLSVLLLIWIQMEWQPQQQLRQEDIIIDNDINVVTVDMDSGLLLLDLAWRMFTSSMWHGTQTKEAQVIGASLVYIDVYATTFQHQHQKHLSNITSHLSHDIGTALRQKLSTSLLSLLDQIENMDSQRLICVLLESQLMWFLHQVLGLFYTKTSKSPLTTTTSNGRERSWCTKKRTCDEDGNDHGTADDDELEVRKVDVDDVLTLVRDLEQWEQQLPNWATWQVPDDHQMTTTTMHPMTRQLHLTLNIVKILLFRPFSTEFKQYGMEQTYTKTTFLDLSIHSADRLATCLCWNKGKKDNWTFAAYQMIWDVVNRVKETFDSDQEIKIQLDYLVHRIDSF